MVVKQCGALSLLRILTQLIKVLRRVPGSITLRNMCAYGRAVNNGQLDRLPHKGELNGEHKFVSFGSIPSAPVSYRMQQRFGLVVTIASSVIAPRVCHV